MSISKAGRPLFLLGLLVPVLGVIGYAVQLGVYAHLTRPWYLLGAFVVGTGLTVAALRRSPTWPRIVATLLLTLLTVGVVMSLTALALPEYAGTPRVGAPLPPIEARLASGRIFDLKAELGGHGAAIVFYRGVW